MRIALSTLEVECLQNKTGETVLALIRALIRREERPELTLLVFENDLPQLAFAERHAQLLPVPEEFRPLEKWREWHATTLPGLARELKFEAVHLPAYRLLNWTGPCPLVATVADPTTLDVPKKYGWVRSWYEQSVLRRQVQQVNRFVVPSRHAAQALQGRFALPESRVTVVSPGVDRERFQPGSAYEAKTQMVTRFALADPFFLRVARSEDTVEDHRRLLQAFHQFKRKTKSEWQLVFASPDGIGAEAVAESLKGSPEAAGVRWLEGLTEEERPWLLHAADAFVFPAREELPDMAPVEAMACGCPVISSTRGALRELVGEAVSFIDPENVDDMAGKLGAMAGGLELRQRWRQAGLAHARKFDWQAVAAETMTVYERATGG